jgi:hypothetical protein
MNVGMKIHYNSAETSETVITDANFHETLQNIKEQMAEQTPLVVVGPTKTSVINLSLVRHLDLWEIP